MSNRRMIDPKCEHRFAWNCPICHRGHGKLLEPKQQETEMPRSFVTQLNNDIDILRKSIHVRVQYRDDIVKFDQNFVMTDSELTALDCDVEKVAAIIAQEIKEILKVVKMTRSNKQVT